MGIRRVSIWKLWAYVALLASVGDRFVALAEVDLLYGRNELDILFFIAVIVHR